MRGDICSRLNWCTGSLCSCSPSGMEGKGLRPKYEPCEVLGRARDENKQRQRRKPRQRGSERFVFIFILMIHGVEAAQTQTTALNPKLRALNAGETTATNIFASDANTQLSTFLAKVQRAYFKYHPDEALAKPGICVEEIRRLYRPYDPKPGTLKNVTDEGRKLYAELTAILSKLVGTKISPRERKALRAAQEVLRYFFSRKAYAQNYYVGDWMLGPDMFCTQPLCTTFYGAFQYAALVSYTATSVHDLERLREKLRLLKESVETFKRNLELGVRAGMVRPRGACLTGLVALKLDLRRFTALSPDQNDTGTAW